MVVTEIIQYMTVNKKKKLAKLNNYLSAPASHLRVLLLTLNWLFQY